MRDDRDLEDRRQRDFDDLQHEIAGRNVGRMRRFGVAETRDAIDRRRADDKRAVQTQLMLLLTDPVYKARYDRAWDSLRLAEQATDTVLDTLTQMIALAEAELDELRDRAARLPDGTRVYRDANGVVRREDGSAVDADLVATILWTGSEPSYEEMQARRDLLEALRDQQGDVERYRDDVLGPARDRLSDEDDPPTLNELDAILRRISGNMPNAVTAEMPEPDPDPTPPDATPTASIAIPNLGT